MCSIAHSVTKLFNIHPSVQNFQLLEGSHDSTYSSTSKSSNPGNHRPICHTCKLLEKHIYGLMYTYPTIMCYWIQNGGSTLVHCCWWLRKGCLPFNMAKMCCIFGYCKAFDSVPHLPLLLKLENLGFNKHILHWISGYLAIHSESVRLISSACFLFKYLSVLIAWSLLGWTLSINLH